MYKLSRIYTAMYISNRMIASAMGKSWDGGCEVVGQDSLSSAKQLLLEHCCW